MAIRTIRWSPDTCGCVVDLMYDETDPTFERATLVTTCPKHAGKSGADIVLENRQKNTAASPSS